jgi:pimeloyl-ACP methyl ester carboxylesterase
MSDTIAAGKPAFATRAQIFINGINLAYSESGSGEPLVLIMGLGADRSAWDLHLAAFETEYRCFAVDNRGAGESSAPLGPNSTEQMADDYAGLIRGLELGPVRVIGVSMGGAIAQQLAIRHPELVAKLVIVSSWARSNAYTAEVFSNLRIARVALGHEDFVRMLQLLIWTPDWFDSMADELLTSRTGVPTVSQTAFVAQLDACTEHDTVEQLAGISVPTLITVGSRDIFTPVELSIQLANLIPGSDLRIFDGAGHAHHWERLDEFNGEVLGWLA